jgi:ribose/xylose/arabinose/galactoside ABC-type transport system permease subunit
VASVRRVRLLFLHPETSVLMLTVLLCAYLGATNQYFLDKQNLLNITEAVSVIGIAAALATYVVIVGGLDLTPVTVFVIAGVVVIKTINAGWPLPAVILCGVLAGGGIGLLNGILISVYDLNPVIVTLGTNFLFTGIAFIATTGEGQLISDEPFLNFWAHKLPGGVPLVSVLMLAVFAAAYITLRYTKLGIHVYAVGGDVAAARLNGISVVRVRLVVYLLAGLASGLAGVVEAGRSGSVAPFGALSQTDLLKIIAAVIIGGTALSGGRGTVWGTFLGSLLFGIIANGLVLRNISNFYQPVVIGGILLTAVLLERIRDRVAVES